MNKQIIALIALISFSGVPLYASQVKETKAEKEKEQCSVDPIVERKVRREFMTEEITQEHRDLVAWLKATAIPAYLIPIVMEYLRSSSSESEPAKILNPLRPVGVRNLGLTSAKNGYFFAHGSFADRYFHIDQSPEAEGIEVSNRGNSYDNLSKPVYLGKGNYLFMPNQFTLRLAHVDSNGSSKSYKISQGVECYDSLDENHFIVGTHYGEVQVWNRENTEKPIWSAEHGEYDRSNWVVGCPIKSVVSLDGEIFISLAGNTIKLWNKKEKNCLTTLEHEDVRPHCVQSLKNAGNFVSCAWDKIIVWKDYGKRIATFEAESEQQAFVSAGYLDKNHIWALTKEDAKIYHITTKKKVHEFRLNRDSCATSFGKGRLLTMSRNGIQLWEHDAPCQLEEICDAIDQEAQQKNKEEKTKKEKASVQKEEKSKQENNTVVLKERDAIIAKDKERFVRLYPLLNQIKITNKGKAYSFADLWYSEENRAEWLQFLTTRVLVEKNNSFDLLKELKDLLEKNKDEFGCHSETIIEMYNYCFYTHIFSMWKDSMWQKAVESKNDAQKNQALNYLLDAIILNPLLDKNTHHVARVIVEVEEFLNGLIEDMFLLGRGRAKEQLAAYKKNIAPDLLEQAKRYLESAKK